MKGLESSQPLLEGFTLMVGSVDDPEGLNPMEDGNPVSAEFTVMVVCLYIHVFHSVYKSLLAGRYPKDSEQSVENFDL